jgi:hypothetical protein
MDSTDIVNTIIDGSQAPNPDSASVVYFISGEDTTSVISGFTIKNGLGTYHADWNGRTGGGIFCHLSGAKIIHNRIIDNELIHYYFVCGGGIEAYDPTFAKAVIIRYNLIANNHMESTSAYPGGGVGCGVDIWGINGKVENNIILSNTTNGRPYGVGICVSYCFGSIRNNLITANTGTVIIGTGRGGGIYLESCTPGTNVINNTITDNKMNFISGYSSTGGGVGILNTDGYDYNEILVDGNIIKNNSARGGGGIFLRRAYNANVSNNVIQNNTADNFGGGVFFTITSKDESGGCGTRKKSVQKGTGSKEIIPVLVNNTISGNSSDSYGGGITSNMSGDFLAFNNILNGNTAVSSGDEMYLYVNCNAYLYYNNINPDGIMGAGTWEGDGNISMDPEFDEDGYHLLPGSPCKEAGTNQITILEQPYSCPEFDIDGDERPFNTFADIGADEIDIPVNEHQDNYTKKLELLQNSPNPFHGTTTIKFNLERSGYVELSIYDITGKKLHTVLNCEMNAGGYKIELDAHGMQNGLYFCVLKTGTKIQTTKMIKF